MQEIEQIKSQLNAAAQIIHEQRLQIEQYGNFAQVLTDRLDDLEGQVATLQSARSRDRERIKVNHRQILVLFLGLGALGAIAILLLTQLSDLAQRALVYVAWTFSVSAGAIATGKTEKLEQLFDFDIAKIFGR